MKTWSQLGTQRDAVRQQQDTNSPSSHFLRKLYGKLTDARGPESYSDTFSKGIEVKVEFDDFAINASHGSTWFPLDINKDDFLVNFQSIDSLKTRIKDEDTPVFVTFEYV